jgi:2-polyprenyl-3-methyl-5-hydroxy-6-metoxy-1,4-benzoquinol methylase
MEKEPIFEGQQPLDRLIARLRYRVARRRIEAAGKKGRILDIGCGRYPLFLTAVDFAEKYAMDRNLAPGVEQGLAQEHIAVVNHCLEQQESLPFPAGFFDVVTMLAVFEHIEPALLVRVHRDIRRVLKPGGLYVLTTPTRQADAVLRGLDRLHLVTNAIHEHKAYYNPVTIASVLEESGFERERMRFGYFEWHMNIWGTAVK